MAVEVDLARGGRQRRDQRDALEVRSAMIAMGRWVLSAEKDEEVAECRWLAGRNQTPKPTRLEGDPWLVGGKARPN